jgi:hypothetical protein
MWEIDIYLKSSKEILDTFEEVDNCASACSNRKNRLGDLDVNGEYKDNRGGAHREK